MARAEERVARSAGRVLAYCAWARSAYRGYVGRGKVPVAAERGVGVGRRLVGLV